MIVEKAGSPYAVIILGQKNAQERATLASDLITIRPNPKPVEVDPVSIDFRFPL
jgi:hypothetical protein